MPDSSIKNVLVHYPDCEDKTVLFLKDELKLNYKLRILFVVNGSDPYGSWTYLYKPMIIAEISEDQKEVWLEYV